MLFPVFILIALSGPLSGQDTISEFCPKGAKWIYDSFGVVFGVEIPDNYVPYVQLVYERDTVIDGLEAKVLVESSIQLDTVIYYKDIVIRQDGWKIYFYADSAFRLLYDYSFGVGDQYTIYIDQWYMDDRNLLIDVTIDSVRDIVLNGVTMPAYHTYEFLGEFIFVGWSYFKTGNLVYLLVYDDFFVNRPNVPIICVVTKMKHFHFPGEIIPVMRCLPPVISRQSLKPLFNSTPIRSGIFYIWIRVLPTIFYLTISMIRWETW